MKEPKSSDIYNCIRKNFPLGVRDETIYIRAGNTCKAITGRELSIMACKLFPEEAQSHLSHMKIQEAWQRIKNTPSLQIEFTDFVTDRYLNTASGVIDLDEEAIVSESELLFSYCADFKYIEKRKRSEAEVFNEFTKSVFPKELKLKRKLLLQTLAYCVSDCLKAKVAFFYIGESNSGKSTLLEVLKRILPENCVTAIPLDRFSNRFSVGRLDGKKLNICTELSEKSFSSLDVFKQITSNEVVTAEHKGKAPFEFRIRCKSINAGNLIPNLDKIEGMDAVINRMIILFFPVSISPEKQDKQLIEKLWNERNIIFSMAVDELVELRKNNFIFEEPSDSKQIKMHLRTNARVFDEFIQEACELAPENRCHVSTLFDSFQQYCEASFVDTKISKNLFLQKLLRLPGVTKKKFRLLGSKPLAGVVGIKLKNENGNTEGQDSEV